MYVNVLFSNEVASLYQISYILKLNILCTYRDALTFS